MRASDLQILGERLTELADTYPSGKKPTPGSLNIWLGALRDWSIDDVLFVLVDLPRQLPRMPTPNDVLKACAERAAQQAIRAAAAHKEAELSLPHDPDSPVARAELAKIKAILRSPKPGPREWVKKTQERLDDPSLSFAAKNLAREAEKRQRHDEDDEHGFIQPL